MFINAAVGIDSRLADQGHTARIFLVSALHALMVGRDLFCHRYGDGAASIICFNPVKRDAEKCTTGTTRHTWIRIVHTFIALASMSYYYRCNCRIMNGILIFLLSFCLLFIYFCNLKKCCLWSSNYNAIYELQSHNYF